VSTATSVPKEGRTVVTVINGTASAAILSGETVRLATATAPNTYKVTNIATGAGSIVRLFGVCEELIATGETGPCVIHGPALALAGGVFAVKNPLTALLGSSVAAGRCVVATAGAAAVSGTGSYLGWSMGVGATGAFAPVFVNTAHVNVG